MNKIAKKILNVMPGNGYIDTYEIRNWCWSENIEFTYNPYTKLMTFNEIRLNVNCEQNLLGQTLVKCRTVRKLLKEFI